MNYETLSNKLGYTFHNPELLVQALCHRSVGKISNERLEFLGDAVLNFIITGELYRRYPDKKEGELSCLRANLVNGEVLANLAGEFQIGKCLQFGSGEVRSGGAQRRSILADAVEAIIGAVYLDGGIEFAQHVVLRWFAELLDKAAGVAQKDPKTLLQELLQMHKLPLPVYTVITIAGASHSQTFTVACQVVGVEEKTIGSGLNKRRAEREAAEKMLEVLSRVNNIKI